MAHFPIAKQSKYATNNVLVVVMGNNVGKWRLLVHAIELSGRLVYEKGSSARRASKALLFIALEWVGVKIKHSSAGKHEWQNGVLLYTWRDHCISGGGWDNIPPPDLWKGFGDRLYSIYHSVFQHLISIAPSAIWEGALTLPNGRAGLRCQSEQFPLKQFPGVGNWVELYNYPAIYGDAFHTLFAISLPHFFHL